MKRFFYALLLSLPFSLHAQIEEVIESLDGCSEYDESPPKVGLLQSIPARLKDGKPHRYCYNKLIGYILNDSILIPLKYYELESPYSDFMICRELGKPYGIINKKGETVVPFEYSYIHRYYFDMVIARTINGYFGLMTQSGKVLIPFEYRKGNLGADSTIVFHSPGKQFIVKPESNEKFHVLMEGTYEDLSMEPSGKRPFFAIKQQGNWGILDYQNRLLLPCEYDKIQYVYGQHVVATKNGKAGIVNLNGVQEVPFVHGAIRDRLKNGLFPFWVKDSTGKFSTGLLDTTGRIIAPPIYGEISQFYHCNLMKVKKDGKCGILDIDGQLRTPIQFSDINNWSHRSFSEEKDTSGKSIVRHREIYCTYFIYRNQVKGKIGLWHINKGEITAPDYDSFSILDPGGAIAVTLNKKSALFNIDGKQLTGFEYDNLSLSTVHPTFACAQANRKKTLLDTKTGKQIHPEYYDDCFLFNLETLNGYFVTKIGDFTALHAPDGHRLTPHKYTGNMTACNSIPEVEQRLPVGRKLVACAKVNESTGVRFFAIDNAGSEYEYSQK